MVSIALPCFDDGQTYQTLNLDVMKYHSSECDIAIHTSWVWMNQDDSDENR